MAALCACDARPPGGAPLPREEHPRILEGGTERPTRLLFGITAHSDEELMRREYAPLTSYLARKIGIPVELVVPSGYDALPEDIASYRVHMALLSPLAYVRAKERNPGLILIAGTIADGSATYASYIVAPAGSPYERIEDLKGKTFGFVDRFSTSGYVYPLAFMYERGLDPETFFAKTVFAENHDRLLAQMLEGKIDAGATFGGSLKPPGGDVTGVSKWRIIAKTGRIPYDAFCASPRLDQAIIEDVRATLLALDTRSEEGRVVLDGRMGINGFVAAGDDRYDDVRRQAQLVDSRERARRDTRAP